MLYRLLKTSENIQKTENKILFSYQPLLTRVRNGWDKKGTKFQESFLIFCIQGYSNRTTICNTGLSIKKNRISRRKSLNFDYYVASTQSYPKLKNIIISKEKQFLYCYFSVKLHKNFTRIKATTILWSEDSNQAAFDEKYYRYLKIVIQPPALRKTNRTDILFCFS